MSHTIIRKLKAYKVNLCELESTYLFLLETTDSNVQPQTFRWSILYCGRGYEVMRALCRVASGVYTGSYRWKSVKKSSTFLKEAEACFDAAVQVGSLRIPELTDFKVAYFCPRTPLAKCFERLCRKNPFYKIESFCNYHVLIQSDTSMAGLKNAWKLSEKIDEAMGKFQQDGIVDYEKILKLLENSFELPDYIKKCFEAEE